MYKKVREKHRRWKKPQTDSSPSPLMRVMKWNTQTMVQWNKSSLILLLISQKFFVSIDSLHILSNAQSWEWLVSAGKSLYFIVTRRGCSFSGSHLPIIRSGLARKFNILLRSMRAHSVFHQSMITCQRDFLVKKGITMHFDLLFVCRTVKLYNTIIILLRQLDKG